MTSGYTPSPFAALVRGCAGACSGGRAFEATDEDLGTHIEPESDTPIYKEGSRKPVLNPTPKVASVAALPPPPPKTYKPSPFTAILRGCVTKCAGEKELETIDDMGVQIEPDSDAPLYRKDAIGEHQESNNAAMSNAAFGNALSFFVSLDRSSGEPLGLKISTAHGSTVVVSSVSGGLAARWNAEHPDRPLLEGDTITSVNGVSGDPAKIKERCSKDKILNISLCRSGNAAFMEMAPAPRPAWEASTVGQSFKAMKDLYPYITLSWHFLHKYVNQCERALNNGDEDRAADILVRIEQEVHEEEDKLAVAFNIFKQGGSDTLGFKQVQFMLEYLGFPSEKKDVWNVLEALDADGDYRLSLVEFQMYIGRMGGSFKLFEVRRARSLPSKSMKSAPGQEEQDDPEWLKDELLAAGVLEDQQAYWRLVVSQSELGATARLLACQKTAVRQIRTLAKSNHESVLWKLQLRVTKLGYKDIELWMTLAWIRELAPIIIHVNLDALFVPLVSDTHYRNQFETATSGGLLRPEVREKWERDLFTGAYDTPDVTNFDRCKYGALNVMNDYRGVVRCAQYGDSYLILKNVRLRCTFSPEDSANLKANRLAVLDFYAHVLLEYSDDELKETIRVANGGKDKAVLGDSCKIAPMKYKECQIHGEVSFLKNVERLVADDRHNSGYFPERLKEICKKHKWKFSWMKDEKARLEKESRQGKGADAWKERLQALAEKSTPDARSVPEGFCLKGCGRKIAPGQTKHGKPFTTCCRGCAMGLGHDRRCSAGTAGKEMEEGLCRNGCGRKVNPGRTLSGRAFDTCCRGCTRGVHDAACGRNVEAKSLIAAPGFCRMGCGRKTPASKDGRTFDTCCKGCACGKAHTAACVA